MLKTLYLIVDAMHSLHIDSKLNTCNERSTTATTTTISFDFWNSKCFELRPIWWLLHHRLRFFFFRSFAARKCSLRIFKCLNIFEWSFLCSDFFGQFAISFLRLLLLPWCIMHTQLFDNSFWTNQQYTVSHEFTFMSIRMNCCICPAAKNSPFLFN